MKKFVGHFLLLLFFVLLLRISSFLIHAQSPSTMEDIPSDLLLDLTHAQADPAPEQKQIVESQKKQASVTTNTGETSVVTPKDVVQPEVKEESSQNIVHPEQTTSEQVISTPITIEEKISPETDEQEHGTTRNNQDTEDSQDLDDNAAPSPAPSVEPTGTSQNTPSSQNTPLESEPQPASTNTSISPVPSVPSDASPTSPTDVPQNTPAIPFEDGSSNPSQPSQPSAPSSQEAPPSAPEPPSDTPKPEDTAVQGASTQLFVPWWQTLLHVILGK